MGHMKRWQARVWGDRTPLERFEFQYRVALRSLPWFFLLSWALLPLLQLIGDDLTTVLLGSVVGVLCLTMAVICDRVMVPALDHYLGRGRLSPRTVPILGTLMGIVMALLVVIEALGGPEQPFPTFLVLFATLPFAMTYCLLVPVRTFLLRHLALSAGIGVAYAVAGLGGLGLLAVVCGSYAGPLLALISVRSGAWSVGAMAQAEQGKEAQARLAVAEERLRFGRDLHDVMGRNLAVIALKSELAGRLAARGKPEAVAEMAEVQRIARETQRDMRAVVRGYREADLGAELAGAHGVLTAAGIQCMLAGTATADTLPDSTQSVLGWVMREATTNVLRHGDPAHCSVTLRREDGDAVLTVENDGVVQRPADDTDTDARPPAPGGTGLAGLRERLADVSGILEAGPTRGGWFRLTARVPVPVGGGSGRGPGGPGTSGHRPGGPGISGRPATAPESRPDSADPGVPTTDPPGRAAVPAHEGTATAAHTHDANPTAGPPSSPPGHEPAGSDHRGGQSTTDSTDRTHNTTDQPAPAPAAADPDAAAPGPPAQASALRYDSTLVSALVSAQDAQDTAGRPVPAPEPATESASDGAQGAPGGAGVPGAGGSRGVPDGHRSAPAAPVQPDEVFPSERRLG
ncbi:sensor histidine kinase [Streptomyces triticagri]|uniref:sensor histidine kinase n=1 Tax=Streptomyces triticagri TaxID=2293568 RepID=UPI0018F48553|nr:sensor histidine kinase [Streptomyces triticagri]